MHNNDEFLLVKKLEHLTDEVRGRSKMSNETPNGDE